MALVESRGTGSDEGGSGASGRGIIAQRFAIDVVGLDENGVAVVGDVDRNTNGAHLHFHVSDEPGLESEGLPFLIDSFGFLGETTSSRVVPDWTDSEPPESAPEAERRSGRPLDGDVLRFP